MYYARIEGAIVVELIAPFYKTEEMRPPAPAPWPQGYVPTEREQAAYDEALAGHENFVVGEVPIAERFTPDIVAQMVEIPEGVTVEQGFAYAEGVFSAPPAAPPPPPPTAAEVLAERDERLREAAIRIAPLQDAVDLGEATPADEALLLAWKQYRIAVNRVTQQPGYPAAVNWPERPS